MLSFALFIILLLQLCFRSVGNASCIPPALTWLQSPNIATGDDGGEVVSSPSISSKYNNALTICYNGYVLFGVQSCLEIDDYLPDLSSVSEPGAYLWVTDLVSDGISSNILYGEVSVPISGGGSRNGFAVMFNNTAYYYYSNACRISAVMVIFPDGSLVMSTLSVPAYYECSTVVSAGFLQPPLRNTFMNMDMYYLHYSFNSSEPSATCLEDAYDSQGLSNISSREQAALEAIFHSTSGATWTYNMGWMNNSMSPCYWYGVMCYNESVWGLYLLKNSLLGTIPESLSILSQLQYLTLSTNSLLGTIPEFLGSLSKLQYLSLHINSLTGTIPAISGYMFQLQGLFLDDNMLTGAIPENLGFLSQLQQLCLYSNKFTGTIPATLGYLSQLQYLLLNNNMLTGTIPKSLGSWVQLRRLDFSTNMLRGTIPETLASLSQIENLFLECNMLTGTIPETLGSLQQLRYLDFSTNMLRGTIPETLASLSQLLTLDLDTNMLTGTISMTLSSLVQLQYLILGNNMLTGTIPESLGFLKQLHLLEVGNNTLIGTIPKSLSSLTQLLTLGLADNMLTGTLTDISGSEISIFMDNNFFIGPFPAQILKSKCLSVLYISQNSFFGTIPTQIGNMTSLTELEISYNKFNGSLPVELSNLQSLKIFECESNRFEGGVRDIFASMRSLGILNLFNNSFTGNLPTLVSLKLSVISLGHNRFRGNFLPSKEMHNSLKILILSDNCLDFSGANLTALCNCKNLTSIEISNMATACIPKPSWKWLTWSSTQRSYSLPSCLWGLPKLEVLSASGNALQIQMPKEEDLRAPLETINIMSNRAYGPLPQNIMSLTHQVSQLQLSRNRISGSLPRVNSHYIYKSLTSVDFSVNRLSCDANSFLDALGKFVDAPIAPAVNILSGNLYDCPKGILSNYNKGDENSGTAECGAALFYFYFVLTGLIGLVVWVGLFVRHYKALRRMINFIKPLAEFSSTSGANFVSVSTYRSLVHWWLLSSLVTVTTVTILAPIYSNAPHPYTCIGGWTGTLIDARPYGALWMVLVIAVALYGCVVHMLSKNVSHKSQSPATLSTKSIFIAKSRVVLISMLICLSLINAGYVASYAKRASIPTFAKYAIQAAVSVGKLLFSTIIPRCILQMWLTEKAKNESESSANQSVAIAKSLQHQQLLRVLCSLVALMSSVLPCFVSAFVDPSCFHDALIPPEPVDLKIPYQTCVVYYANGSCYSYGTAFVNLKEYIPFIFSWNCAGSIMTSYAPLLCLSSFIAVVSMAVMFVAPLIWKDPQNSSVLNFRGSKLYNIFPVVMWYYWDKSFQCTDPDWNYDDFGVDVVIQNVMFLSIQLTFGIAVPWLSVAVWLAMTLTTTGWLAIYYGISQHSPEIMARMGTIPVVPKSIIRIIGIVMAVSLGWLLIDQLDDSDPSATISYISVVMLGVMLLLAWASRFILRYFYSPKPSTEKIEMKIEMSNTYSAESVVNSSSNPIVSMSRDRDSVYIL